MIILIAITLFLLITLYFVLIPRKPKDPLEGPLVSVVNGLSKLRDPIDVLSHPPQLNFVINYMTSPITGSYTNGFQYVKYFNDKAQTHRIDGPAMIYYDKNGNKYREEFWFKGQKLNSEDELKHIVKHEILS